MGQAEVDRNVLFGVLAWQLGVVEREPLMAAMYSWMTDKSRSLPDYSADSGLLSAEDRRWIDEAVDRKLRKSGNDAARSLDEMGSVDSLCQELRGIAGSTAAATLDAGTAPVNPRAKTIAAHGTVPESAAEADVTSTAPASTASPAADRFRIVRAHARGGLGEVFVAIDEELKREVALKQILTRHADNQVSRTRFLLEAEVTGNLEHPGVVPVYGLGSQPDGRPFYAMRFIRGDSLEDAIRRFHEADIGPTRDPGQRALDLRNLLTRFIAVCNTIEYAHSRGFVHRDIKPENIMLGPYGETLVVDWGLARPMEQTGDEPNGETIDEAAPTPAGATADRPTQMGSIVGTPQFMSPEQAAGRLDLIRAPSDVYSLGATLYCILTDQPPFTASDVRKVLRDVREGRFPPPRQVKRDVPRGLDAICQQAMAHDPANRYATPQALAGDIEHWLADEPVSALDETPLEQLQRWMRRHKTWTRAAAAALVIVAAVAGVAYTREATLRNRVETALAQEAKARHEADEARKSADRNAALAQEERLRAEAHARRAEQQSALALATLKSVLFDIQAKLKNVPAAHTVRLSMLNTVIDGLKQVARSLDTAAETDHSLVRAHLDLGDIFLQVGTIEGTTGTAEAQRQFERGVELAEQLREADPASPLARADLGDAYQRMGDVGMQRGNLGGAADWLRKSVELRKKPAAERADDARTQRDLAASIQRLGIVHERLRDLPAAKDFYSQFFKLSQVIVERDPKNVEDRRNLSVSYERMGDISLLEGDAQSAEDFFQKSLAVRRELVAIGENNSPAERDLSVTLDRLGDLALKRGDAKGAEDFYRQSLELRQALYDGDPNNVQSQRDLLVSYALLGDTAFGRRDLKESAKFYQRYHGIAQKLVDADPDNVQFQRDLATAYARQGDVAIEAGDSAAARDLYFQNYELVLKLAAGDPSNAAIRSDLMSACAMLGNLSLQLGDVAEARGFQAEYLGEARRRAEERPTEDAARRKLADALLRSGELRIQLGDLSQARTELNEALALVKKSGLAQAGDYATSMNLANAESLLAQMEWENRDPAAGASRVQAGIAHMRDAAAKADAATRTQLEAGIKQQEQLLAHGVLLEKAAADVEFAAKQDPAIVPDLLDFAAAAQLRGGKLDEAEKTLERLAAIDPKSGANLFAAARRYCAAAGAATAKADDAAGKERRERFLARAVALLTAADKAGTFDDIVVAARLEFADEFKVLKDRKEYADLLEQVRRRRPPRAPKVDPDAPKQT